MKVKDCLSGIYKKLPKPIMITTFIVVMCMVSLHVTTVVALSVSYTKLLAEDYSAARYSAMLSQQLAKISPTLTVEIKKAIDNQVATAVSAEHPFNGVYSALIINSLLQGKYKIPEELSAEEIARIARRANMKKDIGAASIMHDELRSNLIPLNTSEWSELGAEATYDKFVTLVFTAGHRVEPNAKEKLAPILAALREAHEEYQKSICLNSVYRCEINKIRWLVAECNYQRDVLGAANEECFNSVRNTYLTNFGHITQNDLSFERCTKRFGVRGCLAAINELPYYMESFIVGYGYSKAEW